MLGLNKSVRPTFQFLILSAFFFIGAEAHSAFEMAPIIIKVSPSGPSATTSLSVTNTGESKAPIQINIVHRAPDEKGNEDYKETDDIDDLFRVFPSQIILNPKETRSVRVTYTGSPKVTSELPFRIIAEEFPIDLDDPAKIYTKAVAKITISTKYIGSLYVTPSGAKPEIKTEAKIAAEGAKPEIQLTIENKGTAHQVLFSPVLKLTPLAGGKELELKGTDIKDLLNQNILPGKSRKFVIPWPKDFPVTTALKVDLDYKKE